MELSFLISLVPFHHVTKPRVKKKREEIEMGKDERRKEKRREVRGGEVLERKNREGKGRGERTREE